MKRILLAILLLLCANIAYATCISESLHVLAQHENPDYRVHTVGTVVSVDQTDPSLIVLKFYPEPFQEGYVDTLTIRKQYLLHIVFDQTSCLLFIEYNADGIFQDGFEPIWSYY